MSTPYSQQELINLVDVVNRHLAPYQPAEYKLEVVDTDVRRSGDWWYLVVRPTNPDIRVYDYNQIVQRVEDEIEHQEHLKVLLVPAMPD